MKKLFKFIFGLVLFVVLLIVVPLTILYFTISDKIDDAPVELYNESISLNSEVAKLIDRSLDTTDDNVYLALDEDTLDLILFAIIRESVNPNYYNDECTTDSCKYIENIELPEDVPLLGGKKVLVKHAYSKISEKNINAYVTLDILGFIKSKLNIGFEFKEASGVYTIEINKLGLGKLNLMSGFGKMILNPVLNGAGLSEEKINQKIKEKNIPVNFISKDFSFTFKKEDLGDVLKGLLTKQDTGSESKIIGEFVSILTSSDNDLLNLGIYNVDNKNLFGIKLNLKDLKYNELTDGRPTYYLDYDVYQNHIINVLTSDNEKHFDLINKYITSGYANLTEDEQVIINTIDFTPAGIIDKATFSGLINKYEVDLVDSITDNLYQELSDMSDAKISAKIEEDLINQMVYSTGLIGKGFSSYFKDDEGYHLTTIGVEAIWLDVVDNQMGFKLLFNLNGTKISLFTNFINKTPNSGKIEAEFDELRIGSINFSDEMKATIINLIKDTLGESGMEMLNIVDNKIIIDSEVFISKISSEGSFSDLMEIVKNEKMIVLDLSGSNFAANGTIDLNIELTKFQLKEDYTTAISENATPFDTTTFINNKTQTFIINNLSSSEHKILFTQKDFNRMIYSNTNGYEDFKSITTLPNETTQVVMEVEAIFLEFTSTTVKTKFLVTMNGLTTLIVLDGNAVAASDNKSIEIFLADTITMGDITTSSDFILDMFGDNLISFGVMQYDPINKSFILASESFDEMMSVGGNSSQFKVEKIKLINGALEVYVTMIDPALGNLVDNVSTLIEGALQNDFLDEAAFDTTDPNQAEAVNNLTTTLDDISNVLSDPEQSLTPELTDQLINDINQLDEVNQQIFLSQLENETNSQDLIDLYSQLFGNN